MTRDTAEFCRHARTEFAFLTESAFSETHAVAAPHFSIDYQHTDSRVISVGAFLPRYEYYVSLAHNANQFGLDELAAARNLNDADAFNWTWAHSDPSTFCKHITYSANLLRVVLPDFLNDTDTLWADVSSYRSSLTSARINSDKLKQADSAFADGRWGDAIAIYDSVPELTPVQAKRLGIAKRRFK